MSVTKDEWDEGHIPGATHMSRGTIELDIEEKVPDPNAMIICHCGGGGRSALAAESLQKMGYKNVHSMAGGFKAWKAAGLPDEVAEPATQLGVVCATPVGCILRRRTFPRAQRRGTGAWILDGF